MLARIVLLHWKRPFNKLPHFFLETLLWSVQCDFSGFAYSLEAGGTKATLLPTESQSYSTTW